MGKQKTLLDEQIEMLMKLRKSFHGDEATQKHINAVLDKLYYIKD